MLLGEALCNRMPPTATTLLTQRKNLTSLKNYAI